MAILVIFFVEYAGFSFSVFSTFTATLFILNWMLEVPAGAFADKFGRKKCLVAGNTVYVGAIVLLVFAQSYLSLAFVALMYAVGSCLASGTFQATMYEAFSARQATSQFHSVMAETTGLGLWGAALAATVGGWLAAYSLALPLLVDAVALALLTLYLLLRMPPASTQAPSGRVKPSLSIRKMLTSAWRITLASPTLCVLFAGLAITFACVRASFNAYQPLMLDAGIPVQYFGVAFCVLVLLGGGVAKIFSKLPKPWLDRGYPELAVIAVFILGLLPVALLGMSPIFLLLSVAAHQFVRGVFPSYYSYRINREIPVGTPARTTVLSIANLIRALVTAIAVFGIGGIADDLDLVTAYKWINSLAIAALIALVIFPRSPGKNVDTPHPSDN
ncbi:MFS transporter [Pandoraea iniqua]|nr:MFS transporter [Pandoraea iniqua]